MKRKSIRKYFLFVMLGISSFLVNITNSSAHEIVNYNNIHMTQDEYSTLLNLGFTENQIYFMDQETYLNNKDLDATLISQTQRYYKTISPLYGNSYTVEVSEEEYDNSESQNQIKGTVNTYYKTVVSSISQNGSKYRYNVSTLWKNMPSTRSFDIIGIGYSNSNIYINSSVYFSFTYADHYGNYTTSTQYYNKKSTSTGGAAVYKLPSSSIASLSANLYYDVSKNTSSTITTLSICGDYAHAQSTVSQSNVSDYGIGISGISLGPTLAAHYDAIPCAMEYASVNW